MLAATDAGIFRSTDGGITFLALGKAEGLPAGSSDAGSLEGDPTRPGVFLAGLTGVGVFITSDAGGTWKSLGSTLPEGAADKITAASRIRLSIAAGSPKAYYIATFAVGLSAVYRSTDDGASWTPLLPPNPPLNVTYDKCAFASHPFLPIVFAAGYQDANNLHMGSIDSAGAITWTPCTGAGNTADGSTHHTDSRSIAFDALGE